MASEKFLNVEGLEQHDIDREDKIHFFPCFYEGVMNDMLYCSKFRECVPDDFCQGKCKDYEPNVVRKTEPKIPCVACGYSPCICLMVEG
jgi:hypothetical protein